MSTLSARERKIVAIFITMIIALPFMGATMGGYMTRLADMIVSGG